MHVPYARHQGIPNPQRRLINPFQLFIIDCKSHTHPTPFFETGQCYCPTALLRPFRERQGKAEWGCLGWDIAYFRGRSLDPDDLPRGYVPVSMPFVRSTLTE